MNKYVTLVELNKTTQALLYKINEQADLKVNKINVKSYNNIGTKIASVDQIEIYAPLGLTEEDLNNFRVRAGMIDNLNGLGLNATAEGIQTTAVGKSSHAEGYYTKAIGNSSHAEGSGTEASKLYSHAEGYNTTASRDSSHAEGSSTTASGLASHAEGQYTQASKSYSHAEGDSTQASGQGSHAEGWKTIASGSYSHAEGSSTTASGQESHAEGISTVAYGEYSHAEGQSTTASGLASHTEGYNTKASGNYSHAEGYETTASSLYSHAEGYETTASGNYSHAEGHITTASGLASHAEGQYTVATDRSTHVFGEYNTFSSSGTPTARGTYVEIVGNGASNLRSDARRLTWTGNEWLAGTLTTANGNDYVEYRLKNQNEEQQFGQCVYETGDGTLSLSTQRLQKGCAILSDTFGAAIGQNEKNQYTTPIAVSGRVLAYPYEDREEFKRHIGQAVCSGPNGTVSIMTDEEEEKYPLRAIGIISEVPNYEEWGDQKIKVDGRVWIRIQ